jgi:enoyl-CoA hydratase/carnithine racemase
VLRRRPLATLALVQLLRLGERLDAHAGLVAESLVYSTLQSGPEFAEWCASRPAPRPAREPSAPAVLIERSGERLHLTLNRPDKRNAFSTAMRDALVEGLRTAAADPELEVLLDGAGPAFCSGGDLDEFGSLPDPATAHAVRSTRNPARLLAALSERVTAHVHGACVGAGAELPAFARHVRAAEDAFFQLPEIGMGLVPGAGGTVSLPHRIGRQRAGWLALSGARIDARTALSWGLVDEIA